MGWLLPGFSAVYAKKLLDQVQAGLELPDLSAVAGAAGSKLPLLTTSHIPGKSAGSEALPGQQRAHRNRHIRWSGGIGCGTVTAFHRI